MLDRMKGVRHACDLDLLLFFYRHPRALLTSEEIVVYVGHDRERVAKSLDGLIEAGLLTRSQNPSRAVRLYVLELQALPGGLLAAFLRITDTRQGRMEALQLLAAGPERGANASLRRRATLSKVA